MNIADTIDAKKRKFIAFGSFILSFKFLADTKRIIIQKVQKIFSVFNLSFVISINLFCTHYSLFYFFDHLLHKIICPL